LDEEWTIESPFTEMQLVGGPKIYAKIQAIRERSQRKVKNYTLKINIFTTISVILSYF